MPPNFFSGHWFQWCFCGLILFATFVRIYHLTQTPPSLYWEEAALGYDAYSILKTGKDHHGQPFPTVAFRSFGDYKPSGYFYAIVPFEAILGLSPLAVRLPSAVAGVLTVVGISVLLRQFSQRLWPEKKLFYHQRTQLLGLGLASISPWLIQFSRAGWEVNLASCLLLWSVILVISALQSIKILPRTLWLMLAAVLAVTSMYSYHATRVIAPVLLGSLCLGWLGTELFQKKLSLANSRHLLIPLLSSGIVAILFLAPLLFQLGNPATQQRFAETSITADGHYVTLSNQLRDLDNSPASKIFSHRYLILASEVAAGFFRHFTPQFLFVTGDQNPRHSVQFFGIFYPSDSLLLGVGIVTLTGLVWQKKQGWGLILFLILWLGVGILPAALTQATPHALRILPTAAVFFVVMAVGLEHVLEWLSRKTQHKKQLLALTCLAMGGVLFSQFFSYWRYYTRIYPALYAQDWQYGYQQLVADVQAAQVQHPQLPVFITREYGRPAMYYWFFSKTPPAEVQAAEKTAKKDQAEFLEFKNIQFIGSVNEAKDGIIASSAEGFTQLKQQFSSVEQLSEVKDLRGKTVWVVALVASPHPQTR